tara:strand:- start:40 stop:420 length:381 start_codon:yes stop_codon:yes gene_type:complete
MVIGFLKTYLTDANSFMFPDYFQSVMGGLMGFLIVWSIIFVYKKLKNTEGMGLGDAKFLSALGFWFGWISLPFILIFSSVIALSFSIPSLVKKTKTMSTQIPFGPYLILGCLLYLFLINEIQKLFT